MSVIKQLNIKEIATYKQTIISFIYRYSQINLCNENYSFDDALSEYERLADEINNDSVFVLGSFAENVLNGFLWAYHSPFRDVHSRVFVKIFYADPPYEDEKIQTDLLSALYNLMQQRGFSSLYLQTPSQNGKFTDFLLNTGFKRERIQLRKDVLDNAVFSHNTKILTADDIHKNATELEELMYINTHAHINCERYTADDAHLQILGLKSYVEQGNAVVIGFFMDGKIIGFIWVFPYEYFKKPCYLLNAVAVFPQHRKQGIAQVLFNSAEAVVFQKNVDKLYTWVDATNTSAYKFYLKQNMHEVGYQLVKYI